MLRAFLLSLLLCFHALGHAATPEELEWFNAFVPFSDYAKAHGFAIRIVANANPEDGETPIFSQYENEQCLLVVNIRDNYKAINILKTLGHKASETERRIIMQTIWLHELGHCALYASGFPPSSSLAKEEGFADMFALASIPIEEMPVALDFLKELRKDSKGTHNTRRFIARIGERLVNESAFAFAHRIVFE